MKITISTAINKFGDLIEKYVNMSTVYGFERVFYPEKADDLSEEDLTTIHERYIDQSDYLLVINKDGYIGKSTAEEIEYARGKDLTILYTELNNTSNIGIIGNSGESLYIEIPKNHYINDWILGNSEFVDTNMKKILLAARPGMPNVNGYQYELPDLLNVLSSEGISELFDTNSFEVEYGRSEVKADRTSIDPTEVCGTVRAVGYRYLLIQIYPDIFNKVFADIEITTLAAHMRSNGVRVNEYKSVVYMHIVYIITWDIAVASFPDHYWEKIK